MSRFHSKLNKIIFSLLMLLLGYSVLNGLSLPKSNIANISLVKSTSTSPFISTFQPRVGQVNGKDYVFQLMPNGNIYLFNSSGQSPDTSLDNDLSGSIKINTDRSEIYWMARGIIAYQKGQVDSAVNLWSNAPDISSYLILLSQSYDDPSHAINLIKLANHINPTANGYFELGKRFEEENSLPDADEAYLQALELSQKINDNDLQVKVLVHLGEMYFRDGDYQSAIIYFEKAIQLNSYQSAWLTVRIAQSFIRLGRVDLANNILEDLLDKQSDSAYAWWVLGEARRRLGKPEEALEAYQEYKKLRPNDDRVLDRIEKLHINNE